MDMNLDFINLRNKLISREFNQMNPVQKNAIFNIDGPLLILAGAGTGKTTVIINRIANMVMFGHAYNSDAVPNNITNLDMSTLIDCLNSNRKLPEALKDKLAIDKVNPSNILAITFTNKAAKELKERLYTRLSDQASEIWASTFHSTCARILRCFANKIGYSNHFAIYDTSDVKSLIKECLKHLDIQTQKFDYRYVINQISNAKNNFISPNKYSELAKGNSILEQTAKIYQLYQKKLKLSDAMDFDDLICNTIKLFEAEPSILEHYQNKFKYILVDEYQDTNYVQYLLIKMLAKHQNLCVVGDDDQSIYKFRGATIENIMNFEKTFPNAKVIKLEQNYRSTQNILDAANSVIKHNPSRKGKTLWTSQAVGDKITVHTAYNEIDEANYIVNTILDNIALGKKYSDFAILYRNNSQSNTLERTFVKSGIPYRILGGVRFYERKEVKDMLAYLSVISNPEDEVRLKRIINTPRRSIGDKTVSEINELALEKGIPTIDIIRNANKYPDTIRVPDKFIKFANIIDSLIEIKNDPNVSISQLYSTLIDKINYKEYLLQDQKEGAARLENINELASNIINYETENGENATLEGFLEEVSLMTDVDNYNQSADAVVMMTMHSSKGLEFPVVFLPGFEDGIFPSLQSIYEPEEIEEERRLAYVAITRAKQKLYILNADRRMIYGMTSRNKQSRFTLEIDPNLVEVSRSRGWKKPDSDFKMPKTSKEIRENSINSAKQFGGVHKYKLDKEVDYSVGDFVSHKVFGSGKVMKVTPMGNDHLLEIEFDKAGLKKIMSNYSKLEKI